jgi:CPA1 family monovalent cation:H+ antiporter
MFLGAILPLVPVIGFEVEQFYNIVNGIPEIILLIIIPILIFESGRKLKIGEIKKEALPIGFFAIIGVVITIVIIGIGANPVSQIPFIDALLFGTILAATDPVAVGVIFKKFPIPHKLNTVLDVSISFIWSMVGAIALGTGLAWVG